MDYIKVFKDHILYDRIFLDDFVARYHDIVERFGQYIAELRTGGFILKDTINTSEFIDYIDDNGFTIFHARGFSGYVMVDIVYTTEEKKKYGKEEKEPSLSMDAFISTSSLYDSSMETCERYILEYKKLLASWDVWICLCRRVELLRLVPEGRCGSTPVPRPP